MQEKASSILSRWLQLTNSTAVWSGGLLKIIPYGDSPVTGARRKTWHPQHDAALRLTDEDFLHVGRRRPGPDHPSRTRIRCHNQQAVEIQARSDYYNTGPVDAFDQAAIDRFGLRIGSTITAHEICDLDGRADRRRN